MASKSQSERPNSGGQEQPLMESKSSPAGSERGSSWKNKYLQERFTQELMQVEMKWRLMLKGMEEKKDELECLFLPSKGGDKSIFSFLTKTNNQAEKELKEKRVQEETFQGTIRELEESNQKLTLMQNSSDRRSQELEQQMRELEEKDEGWRRKVMELEKEKEALAEKMNSWEKKVKNAELHKELAEKQERWAARVHKLKEERRKSQIRTLKNKVREFQRENELKVDRDDEQVRTEVKAGRVKYEELMEKQQSLERKIKETDDKNSSLAQKLDELERKVSRLEEERRLEQSYREQMKARIERLMGACRKWWERKVATLKEMLSKLWRGK